jgi:alpha/beta superfamily hydrolase
MIPEVRETPGAGMRAFAVLLPPHPDYGGNRFHPFIAGLFGDLPAIGISAIRFDFSSSLSGVAHEEACTAIDAGAARWPEVPVVLVGYSFGAGIAAGIADERVAGWYLLAPQAPALTEAAEAGAVGADPRPKAIAVPEFDQFSSPARVGQAVKGWKATSVTTVLGSDHFLGEVEPLVADAVEWIESIVGTG